MAAPALVIGLNAVIMAAREDAPLVLVIEPEGEPCALPFGSFEPEAHRTFELALRDFVKDQTGFELGYVEQLYTFGDRGREAPLAELKGAENARVISVGYLGLTREPAALPAGGGVWTDWYRFFPWEDWREGKPAIIADEIEPSLRQWASCAQSKEHRAARLDRAALAFAFDDAEWNEERALDRYELLYEAGLAPEAAHDHGRAKGDAALLLDGAGRRMASDHRRILATAISRLRAKIKYRPVLFELAPERFTLGGLQRLTEAIVGVRLHTQNFRRALDKSELVEGTGVLETGTGGRPAELFRLRPDTLRDRPSIGVATPRLR